jgi:hypothetical protein
MLDQEMRMRSVEHRVEAAHYHRVREAFDRLGLFAQLAERALVLRLVRSDDLRHHHREEVLVPDEVDLVAPSAAEPLQHRAPRHDLRARLELPARLSPLRAVGGGGVAHGEPARGRAG